jgi:hypothetical protein
MRRRLGSAPTQVADRGRREGDALKYPDARVVHRNSGNGSTVETDRIGNGSGYAAGNHQRKRQDIERFQAMFHRGPFG